MNEMEELRRAFDIRQQRLVEISGSIKTLQELMNDEGNETMKENVNTTEK